MPCTALRPSHVHRVCLTKAAAVYADRCPATSNRLGVSYAVVIL